MDQFWAGPGQGSSVASASRAVHQAIETAYVSMTLAGDGIGHDDLTVVIGDRSSDISLGAAGCCSGNG